MPPYHRLSTIAGLYSGTSKSEPPLHTPVAAAKGIKGKRIKRTKWLPAFPKTVSLFARQGESSRTEHPDALDSEGPSFFNTIKLK